MNKFYTMVVSVLILGSLATTVLADSQSPGRPHDETSQQQSLDEMDAYAVAGWQAFMDRSEEVDSKFESHLDGLFAGLEDVEVPYIGFIHPPAGFITEGYWVYAWP